MEETLFFPSGHLFTRGPGNYKLPGFRDIPQDLRVSLLQNADYHHLKTIQSSKGIGEPPFFLGSSVLFALRDAVKHARYDLLIMVIGRAEAEVDEVVCLQSPATSERLRLACKDWISGVAEGVTAMGEGENDWVVVV